VTGWTRLRRVWCFIALKERGRLAMEASKREGLMLPGVTTKISLFPHFGKAQGSNFRHSAA